MSWHLKQFSFDVPLKSHGTIDKQEGCLTLHNTMFPHTLNIVAIVQSSYRRSFPLLILISAPWSHL